MMTATIRLFDVSPVAVKQLEEIGFVRQAYFIGPKRSGKTIRAEALCRKLRERGHETRIFEGTANGEPCEVVYARMNNVQPDENKPWSDVRPSDPY
ncbi:hypothetical protein M2322_003004 [Rhodoblastus acidophilus]|nr:hypothetical protein [Rhodoblastus acidophilus]